VRVLAMAFLLSVSRQVSNRMKETLSKLPFSGHIGTREALALSLGRLSVNTVATHGLQKALKKLN
jgi:hypothetical protein